MVDTTSGDGLSSYDLQFSAVSWDPLDYINFTEAPVSAGSSKMFRIFIDDNDPSRNWSVYVQNYTWCTGSGIVSDPYVIDNLYINGNGSAGMIFVKNSDKFFTIKNCWFNFSGPNQYDAGVLLQYSTNGLIVNNSFTYTARGVTLEHLCSNVVVDNNIFISDHTTAGWGRAIQIDSQCDTIVISKNKIRDYFSGMSVSQSVNITLTDNYLESTVYLGYDGNPILCGNMNGSKIIRNIFAGSFANTSTFSILDSNGQGNTVTNNVVGSGEPWAFGPETAGVLVSTPQTSQGSTYQILLYDSYNNLISNNALHGFVEGGNGGAIPGFDIFILMGMFGVVSVFFLVLKHKRQ